MKGVHTNENKVFCHSVRNNEPFNLLLVISKWGRKYFKYIFYRDVLLDMHAFGLWNFKRNLVLLAIFCFHKYVFQNAFLCCGGVDVTVTFTCCQIHLRSTVNKLWIIHFDLKKSVCGSSSNSLKIKTEPRLSCTSAEGGMTSLTPLKHILNSPCSTSNLSVKKVRRTMLAMSQESVSSSWQDHIYCYFFNILFPNITFNNISYWTEHLTFFGTITLYLYYWVIPLSLITHLPLLSYTSLLQTSCRSNGKVKY